ncbi:MAG: condensation domain-containing protein [Chthoniobacterales bacterium]
MSGDKRVRLREWLQSGEARLEPLTFPQRELWEAAPLPVTDVSNHICATIRARGALSAEGAEAALQKVVDRHEVFRLSFLPGRDQSVQMIRDSGKPEFTFRELSAAQRQPVAIEELAREVFRKPFDLLQGPLYRLEMFERGPGDHELVFAIHHAIADGWTLGIFFQDLVAAYLEWVMGSKNGRRPLPLTYSQWGAGERAFWQPAELERCSAYWQSALAGTRRFWNSPTEAAAVSGERERFVALIPPALGRAVRELARGNGATLFSILLACFQIAVSKWTGIDDILVGTPVANRRQQAVRETMGSFASIVPLRGRVEQEREFVDMLKTVHQTTVDSFAHAMPFAELVRALDEPVSPGRNPIFEIRFALQNHPAPDAEVPSLSLQFRLRSTGTARFDLGCEINEDGDALEVAWLYRHDLFGIAEIQKLADFYQAVLASVCRSPESRVGALLESSTGNI